MEVANKVRDIISEHSGVDSDNVTDEASLRTDLGLDSLEVVEVTMAIEEAFEVSLEDEEMDSIHTVGDMIRKIQEKTGA